MKTKNRLALVLLRALAIAVFATVDFLLRGLMQQKQEPWRPQPWRERAWL